MVIWSPISVGSLPTISNAYDEFIGARALPSISGNGAYLQCRQYFYELTCTSSSCDWNVMEHQLTKPLQKAVMMYLPTDYSTILFPNQTLHTCWIKFSIWNKCIMSHSRLSEIFVKNQSLSMGPL